MEELVARPLKGAHHDFLTTFVELERPAAARLVVRGRLQESLIEGSIWMVKLCSLFLILHVSEVQVTVELKTGFRTHQSSEGLIAAHLMLRGHFKGANRANLTIIFDSVDHSSQPIQFYKSKQKTQH